MWMECPGSMAFQENHEDSSSAAADNGTASHTIGAWCLETGKNAEDYPFPSVTVNGVAYDNDDERANFVQTYIDDIRRSAIGGSLWVEHHVDLSSYLGDDQGGTGDAIIILPEKRTLIAADLKYGVGERVYASYEFEGTRRINHQLGMYLLGSLDDAALVGHQIDTVRGEIIQPRLNHIERFEMPADELRIEFGVRLRSAVAKAGMAMTMPIKDLDAQGMLRPGYKTCLWCRAKAKCPALRRFSMETAKMLFEDDEPTVPTAAADLAVAYRALPLVKQWVKATEAAVWKGVLTGEEIEGPDGQPLKIVQDESGGKRVWVADKLLTGDVESALVGVLGPKAYVPPSPPQLITAPVAAKLLDKKKTAAMWAIFEPMIEKQKGPPKLVPGSDPRPAIGQGASLASEFGDDDVGMED